MPQIILIEKSTVIQATPARIFKSLTDAKQLSRWLADRVESDPQEGGQIVVYDSDHEKRGEYRRLIPGVEMGIRWTQFEEAIPIDLTGFKLDKVPQGTRVRVVDFARRPHHPASSVAILDQVDKAITRAAGPQFLVICNTLVTDKGLSTRLK